MVRIGTLVLIPESTRKVGGGDPYRKMVDDFADALPESPKQILLNLRTEVASRWRNPTAIDGLLPAHQRFDGNMYRRIPRESWDRRKPGIEVLIVSGLYGIVASRDTVFAYPHSMAEPMAPFGKMNRWWQDKGLPSILAAYLEAVGPDTVVDLLSQEYRHAVEGYGDTLTGIDVKPIDFPGTGRGSQPRRGEKVARILRTGKV